MPAAESARRAQRHDRRLRRRLAAPLLGLTVLAATAGCYTNNGAATQHNYQTSDGVETSTGQLEIRNLLVVSTGDGGTLVGGIANDGPDADTLRSVTVDGRPARVTLAAGTLNSLRLVSFGLPDGPQVFASGTFQPGGLVPVVMTFQRAAPVNVSVPVVNRYDYYSAVPTPGASVPTATPSVTLGANPPSRTQPPGGTPEPGATGGLPTGS